VVLLCGDFRQRGGGGGGGVTGDLGWAEGRSGSGGREGNESTVGTGARSVS